MSISKMRKLILIAPSDDADAVIKKLIELRCIDIRDFSSADGLDLLQKKDYGEQIALGEERLREIDGVISALSKYAKKKIRLGDSRKRISREEFVASGEREAAGELLERAKSALGELEAASAQDNGADKANRLEDEISRLAGDIDKLEILYDIERTELEVVSIKQKAAYSDVCTFILGWMPQKSREKVERVLSECLCAYEITEPEDDDEPPVRISGNIFTRSFEWITKGFGAPKYSTFDPTLIMSIFCFLAFGLMIHDVGYGIILMIVGLAGAGLAGMRGKARSVFNMLGICGISSVIFGVLLGGWFGNMPYAVMQGLLGVDNAREIVPFFDGVWFKAEASPIFYLVLCLGLGAAQILVGMIIRFVLLCREGKTVDAILDILPWWIVFAGIAVAFALNLVAGLVTIGAGVLAILLFHGRDKRNVFARLGKGFLSIGRIALYAVDLASYLKLFVVGISVGIITYYVNLLCTLVGPTTLGYILFALVSVVGHAICLCLSALAATVFAKSLQHSEFFERFYVCAEDEFVPAQPCEKYTVDIRMKERAEAV